MCFTTTIIKTQYFLFISVQINLICTNLTKYYWDLVAQLKLLPNPINKRLISYEIIDDFFLLKMEYFMHKVLY